MSDQTSPVAAGTLSGINLSGEDEAPDATLPAEDDRTLAEAATEAQPEAPEVEVPVEDVPEVEVEDEPEAPQEAPAPAETPVEAPAAPEAPDAPQETETAAEAPKKTGAPARPYVVLKEDTFEDSDESYFTKVHEVQARNAQNAMRQAFKDLIGGEGDVAEATLVVIPKSMFRPTPVRLNKTERVSVSFG